MTDIGVILTKLGLASYDLAGQSVADKPTTPFHNAQRRALGLDGTGIGTLVGRSWHLPDKFVNVIHIFTDSSAPNA